MQNKIYNTIVIWSGPAWHTASIYLSRSGLEPLMFEGFYAWWVAAWWQLTTTTEVENFPWFAHGISWPKLMEEMRVQSINSWTKILTQTVDQVDLSRDNDRKTLIVYSNGEQYHTESIILATWATAKKLDVPWVEKYRMKGISWCAVCDWALPIFRNKILAVVWWWDVAMEEAMHLSKFWSEVLLIHRRDSFRASKSMQERVMNNNKIKIIRNTQVKEVHWDESTVNWLTLIENNWNESTVNIWGLFFAIWHTPNTWFLDNQLELDENWYIVTYRRVCEEAVNGKKPLTPEKEIKFRDGKIRYDTCTSVSGVFAAWDVADKIYRQAITSAGTWCMAALDCERWLEDN